VCALPEPSAFLFPQSVAGGTSGTDRERCKLRRSRSLDNGAVSVNDHLVKLLRIGVATNDVNGRGANEGL
jgi:hypothetical protein